MDDKNVEIGPALDKDIISWLARHAADRTVRLPIEIHGNSLRVETSFLIATPDFIRIWLDTGALSIDLPMHLKRHCRSYPCWVWLEGTWGPLISGGFWQNKAVLAVRQVVGLVEGVPTNALFPR